VGRSLRWVGRASAGRGATPFAMEGADAVTAVDKDRPFLVVVE
jgi:hypothetical protein